MNILSSLLNFIGLTIGADPNTLTTTSKTFVGAINEVASDVTTLKKDYIIDKGTTSGWVWRKWNSGKIEAWYRYSGSSVIFDVLSSPIRYKNITLSIPSGIFTTTPYAVANSASVSIFGAAVVPTSATSADMRFFTTRADSIVPTVYIYAFNMV